MSRSVSDGWILISAFCPLASYMARVLARRKNPHCREGDRVRGAGTGAGGVLGTPPQVGGAG